MLLVSVFVEVLLASALRFVVVLELFVVLGLVFAVALASCVGVFLQVRLLLVRLRSIFVCTSHLRVLFQLRLFFL